MSLKNIETKPNKKTIEMYANDMNNVEWNYQC